MNRSVKVCALCERQVPEVTRHHLVPRSRTRKRKRRGQLERRDRTTDLIKGEVRPGEHVTIDLCRACHGMVHAVLSEKELEQSYYTVELLLAHAEIGEFVKWAAKQDAQRKIPIRAKRNR